MPGIAVHINFTVKGGKFGDRIPKAIARGLNEGGDLVRTQVRRALKTQTNVKAYKSIASRTEQSGKGTNRASAGKLEYAIYASGKGIPIKEFKVSNTGHGISATPWGETHLFKRSFGIAGRGVEGYRARLGKSRFPIRGFYGPSLPKELVKGEAAATFYRSAGEVVPPAIIKHLGKALG